VLPRSSRIDTATSSRRRWSPGQSAYRPAAVPGGRGPCPQDAQSLQDCEPDHFFTFLL